MDTMDFPLFCTGNIIVNFGESYTAEGGNFAFDEEEARLELRKIINNNRRCCLAMLVAVTNNEQKGAIKLLKEFGFEGTPWMYKRTHADTKVKMWWLNIAKHFGEVDNLRQKHKKAKTERW